MKSNFFILFILTIFFSFSSNSELIFENEFPKKIQGIWSVDCEAGLQVHVIGKNSSIWIDEDYVGLNISKTSNINGWIAYKWGEIDGSYYYFLNKNSQNQLMELTPPDEWDGIDYTFLNTVSINNLKIRLKKRRNLNKYDKFNSYFYTKVQKGYLKLAKNKKNYLIVNSDKDISLNKKIIINKIEKLIYN